MPNRVLRDWTDSKRMNSLSWQEEVLFTRIIMKADDYGNFHADIKILKSLCFPRKDGIRESDISAWLDTIRTAGLIRLYNAKGDTFLHIKEFKQRLDKSKRKFPEEPPEEADTGTVELVTDSVQETKPNESETKRDAQARDDFSYENFIIVFNELTRRHYKGDASSKGHFAARQREGYKKEDFRRAIENCLADPFHKEKNFKYLTPEFILRPDKFDKFINATPVPEFNKASTTLPKAATEKNIGATVIFKTNGKKGQISGVANGKYQLTFPDGLTDEALPIEIIITASAPKRNMAEPTALNTFIKEIRPHK